VGLLCAPLNALMVGAAACSHYYWHVICVFIGKQSLSDCWIGLALILFRRQSVGA